MAELVEGDVVGQVDGDGIGVEEGDEDRGGAVVEQPTPPDSFSTISFTNLSLPSSQNLRPYNIFSISPRLPPLLPFY